MRSSKQQTLTNLHYILTDALPNRDIMWQIFGSGSLPQCYLFSGLNEQWLLAWKLWLHLKVPLLHFTLALCYTCLQNDSTGILGLCMYFVCCNLQDALFQLTKTSLTCWFCWCVVSPRVHAGLELSGLGGWPPQFMSTDAHFWVKIGL